MARGRLPGELGSRLMCRRAARPPNCTTLTLPTLFLPTHSRTTYLFVDSISLCPSPVLRQALGWRAHARVELSVFRDRTHPAANLRVCQLALVVVVSRYPLSESMPRDLPSHTELRSVRGRGTRHARADRTTPNVRACAEQLPSTGSSTHRLSGVRWARARESPPRKMSSSTS